MYQKGTMVFVELLVCVIALAFSLFLFVLSLQFPPSTQAGVPSAAFFPGIVSAVIFGLSLTQLIINLIKQKKIRSDGGTTQPGTEQGQSAWKQALRIVEIVLLILLYSLLWIFNVGHFLVNSIVIFIPISMLYGGGRERQWWKTSIFVVVLVVFIYVLFKYLLKVAID